ncbi:hypothetical protein NSA29_12620 [Staphylococcus warneri]|uniref:hypothetical protein n=1 Tax=Staphylococcus warneri TaxID=1292 RepID=UPI00214CDA04|nr:hypothetical protein [Staphylococcus warneri]MCR1798371.1 hypothetical protein [Staphylococcus warneri]
MDKQILNYLDKIGEKLSGVTAKGFEVYVHGVFVKSLVCSIFSLMGIIVCVTTFILIIKSTKRAKINKEDGFFYNKRYDVATDSSSMLIIFSGIGAVFLSILLINSVIGIFAPDYVALKDIIKTIKG